MRFNDSRFNGVRFGIARFSLGLLAATVLVVGLNARTLGDDLETSKVEHVKQAASCCKANNAARSRRRLMAFTANWCGPCQKMEPMLSNLTKFGYAVERVDVEKSPDLVRQFHVTSLPTFVAISGRRETGRTVGTTSESKLKRMLSGCNASAIASPSILSGAASTPRSKCMCRNTCVEGASDVQPLLRASYELPKGKAEAFTALLREHARAETQTELNGSRLTVTASPEVQRAIGRFVAILLSDTIPDQAEADCCHGKSSATNDEKKTEDPPAAGP